MADGGQAPEEADAPWRAPASDRVTEALGQVPRRLLVPGVCEPLADLDAPVGCLSPVEQAPPCPSPSAASLLLEAADISAGDRVLVQGRAVGWLGLAAGALAEGGVVHVEEEHEALGARWRSARPFRMRDDVRLTGATSSEDTDFDRVVAWSPGPGANRRLPGRLDETGSVLIAQPDPEEPRLARVVRQGEADTTMTLTELALPGVPAASEAAPTAGDLLRQEALLAAAWTGERSSRVAREVGLSVDETIGQALADQGLVRRAPERAAAARLAFHLGYTQQTTGHLDQALEAYAASVEVLPTAEAYTFRGWVHSLRDELSAAIEDCQRAIDEDPSLGNPYNDIGTYRLEQGHPSEAIDWFEKALDADRYASPEFPYLNMARAYLALDEPGEARGALLEALELRPGFEPARRLLERIDEGPDGVGC
jgi:Tfp pilus assembly protein PilF/protein-L-isoaspartate O-methyltransferase